MRSTLSFDVAKGNGGPDSANISFAGTCSTEAYCQRGSPPAILTATYNLNSGLSGTGNINGTPVYVSSPASGYYHYQLALVLAGLPRC